MSEWILNVDWKFWLADVAIPIVTFILGIVVGKTSERKAKSKISGNNNTVIQNSDNSKK